MECLKFVELHHKDLKHRQFALYECVCGNKKVLNKSLVDSKNTRSCGCLKSNLQKSKKLPNNYSEITAILLQYKRHAKDRDIEWNLSREEAEKLFRSPCFYCGDLSGNLKKTKNCKEGFPHNGIDRLDRQKSYSLTNVVPCCGTCNMSKGKMSKNEFISFITKVYKHQSAMADQWGVDG